MTREAILEGAIRAFARKGYDRATMADIAGESGYSAPALYNYFKKKGEIVEALATHLAERFLSAFDEPVPSGLTLTQKVELLVARQFALADRHREAFLVFTSLHARASVAENKIRTFREFIRRLSGWMRAAVGPGQLGGRDPVDLALLLWGIGSALEARALLSDDRPALSPERRARQVVDFFLHGIGLQ